MTQTYCDICIELVDKKKTIDVEKKEEVTGNPVTITICQRCLINMLDMIGSN